MYLKLQEYLTLIPVFSYKLNQAVVFKLLISRIAKQRSNLPGSFNTLSALLREGTSTGVAMSIIIILLLVLI